LLAAIVLVFVDLLRHFILLTVHLLAFLLCQLATVGGAIIMNFLVDARFILLQVLGLTGS